MHAGAQHARDHHNTSSHRTCSASRNTRSVCSTRRTWSLHRVEERQHAVRWVPQRVRHAVEAAGVPDQGARIEGFQVQTLVVEDRLWRMAGMLFWLRAHVHSKVQEFLWASFSSIPAKLRQAMSQSSCANRKCCGELEDPGEDGVTVQLLIHVRPQCHLTSAPPPRSRSLKSLFEPDRF